MVARAEAHQGFPQGAYLREAATVARSVQVKPLVDAGYTGQGLGDALQQRRLEALQGLVTAQREDTPGSRPVTRLQG
jgi:tRNA nucleotidyltransferase (CCA-adding enzyme)